MVITGIRHTRVITCSGLCWCMYSNWQTHFIIKGYQVTTDITFKKDSVPETSQGTNSFIKRIPKSSCCNKTVITSVTISIDPSWLISSHRDLYLDLYHHNLLHRRIPPLVKTHHHPHVCIQYTVLHPLRRCSYHQYYSSIFPRTTEIPWGCYHHNLVEMNRWSHHPRRCPAHHLSGRYSYHLYHYRPPEQQGLYLDQNHYNQWVRSKTVKAIVVKVRVLIGYWP